MKFLNDLSAFLEQRLDEFLAANPGLQLQILLLEVEQQEQQTRQLVQSLHQQQQQAESAILGLVDEMRKWTDRIAKAEAANRQDLAQAARQREQELRQKGNTLWQQMKTCQQQLPPTLALLEKITARRQEITAQLQQTAATPRTRPTSSPFDRPLSEPIDPLEQTFRELELKQALEELKRCL